MHPRDEPARHVGEAGNFGYDDGFYFRSADGRAKFHLGGLFQFDALHYGARRTPDSEFDVHRMRLELGFTFDDVFRVSLEPNFLPEGTEMEEAAIGFDLREGKTRVLFGRVKAPFGLEEVRSRKWIDFPRFSLLNQFAPAEDHGVFVDHHSDDGAWEFGFAAYNGTGDADSNSSKDIAARASWRPFAACADSCARELQLGIAATTGSQDASADDHPVRNEVGSEVIAFGPGVRLDGSRERVDLELSWTHGPWFAQAEWLHVSEEFSNGGPSEDVSISGAYLDVSYVLTGEARGDGKVRPDERFDLRALSGSGAWVLAARWSELDLDDDLGAFATAGTFTDSIRSASLGLNWFANEHVLVRHTWIHSFYSDPVDVGGHSVSDEDSFAIELQLSF